MTRRGFEVLTYGSENSIGAYHTHWDDLFKHYMHRPSESMMRDFLIGIEDVEEVRSWKRDYGSMARNCFQGDEFPSLLDRGNFNLFVLENSMATFAMDALAQRDIPIVGLVCYPVARDVNDRFGVLAWLNGLPSWTNGLKNSRPTFIERLQTLLTLGRFYSSFTFKIQPHTNQTLTGMYDVTFIHDHPAFSFPYISAPNTFYLGLFNLESYSLNPLSAEDLEFLANCQRSTTVFLTFGSYIRNITSFKGTLTILNTLRKLDFCVIMKGEPALSSTMNLPADKFMVKSWLPQKDLLGSGKVGFYISHCGNNGRIEGIFYNIPMICIPLMGDEYNNGRLVERNKFGVLLAWENLTGESLKLAINQVMVQREEFSMSMKKAVEIVSNDPGSGAKVLKFYADLLIKNNQAEFLVNRVVMNPPIIEILNFDIVAVAVTIIMCLIQVLFLCLVKYFRTCRQETFRTYLWTRKTKIRKMS